MKILSCVLFLLISAPQLKAQACDGQRYFDEIFTVDVTSGIKSVSYTHLRAHETS